MDLASLLAGFLSWSQEVAVTWGYLGIFLVNLIGSATIIFPIPAFLVVFIFGAILNPWLVGISAAFGAALGEVVGYAVGLGGKKVIEKKYEKWLKKANKWMEKHRAFFIVTLFAATPLPDDILGIFCGAIKYDLKKFFLASLTGKLIMNLSLALGGYFGMQWVLTIFGGV
jgi:membrane protein YqaA with SNARE-associated domain